jgi:aminopeptidase YwaD
LKNSAEGQGTRNEFFADLTPYAAGSDHDDYDSSMIAVPSLYLRDWPDIYIHTDHDSLLQIDATKLRRVALLGAASGYAYASIDSTKVANLLTFEVAQSEARLAQGYQQAKKLLDDARPDASQAWYEARNLLTQTLRRETGVLRSLVEFAGSTKKEDSEKEDAEEVKLLSDDAARFNAWIDREAKVRGAQGTNPVNPWANDATAHRIPVRTSDFGPLTYQNDDVLVDRLGRERVNKIKLLNSEATPLFSVQDQSELYAYEIFNFVDGKRTVGGIRDAVSAEYGPLPIDLVTDYLNACSEAKLLSWK